MKIRVYHANDIVRLSENKNKNKEMWLSNVKTFFNWFVIKKLFCKGDNGNNKYF